MNNQHAKHWWKPILVVLSLFFVPYLILAIFALLADSFEINRNTVLIGLLCLLGCLFAIQSRQAHRKTTRSLYESVKSTSRGWLFVGSIAFGLIGLVAFCGGFSIWFQIPDAAPFQKVILSIFGITAGLASLRFALHCKRSLQ